MSNRKCSDADTLYDFAVVTLERGHAEVLDQGRWLDKDNMTAEEFRQARLAQYVNNHGVTPEQATTMRVFCYPLQQWGKPPLHYEEKQLDVLADISERLSPGGDSQTDDE